MKELLLLFTTILLICRTCALLKDDWISFVETHGKVYDNPIEEKMRMNIFAANKEMIDKHNLDYELGKVSYKLKMNHFGDLLHHEFTTLMNGYKRNLTQKTKSTGSFMPPANVQLPTFVDWRKSGAVTPIKDQGQCGSCWSFSATGALEGQYFRKTGKLLPLSEQNLMDCSTSYGNLGCNGGVPELAFQYISDNHGIDSEDSYPYEAKNDVCRYNPIHSVSSDRGYIDLPAGDEEALKAAVATIGPISIAIDATSDKFHFYSEGIFDEPTCSSSELDHAVLAIGYGTAETGDDYWIVKNSWGENWGEQGFIKMARNKNNRCGIATSATYPLV
ncbi:hypothetical protein O3M35_003462 [Rhynocoris fuscipes]|uniref:Cathepsin L n=1 Tax=Rhynocoris fuscipes TaxID=488301 RepID=A0AAW1CIZ6_9HEMI